MLSPNVLNILHSTEAIPHCTDVILSLYWTTSTVLKVSPTVLKLSPTCTAVIPHSTEGSPPQYWLPSTVLMLSPTVLDNLHSTEAIPHCTEQPPQHWSYPPQYWCYPPTVLMLSPRCTEQPPMYWTTTTVLNRRYMGCYNFWIICQQLRFCFRFSILIKLKLFGNKANQSESCWRKR